MRRCAPPPPVAGAQGEQCPQCYLIVCTVNVYVCWFSLSLSLCVVIVCIISINHRPYASSVKRSVTRQRNHHTTHTATYSHTHTNHMNPQHTAVHHSPHGSTEPLKARKHDTKQRGTSRVTLDLEQGAQHAGKTDPDATISGPISSGAWCNCATVSVRRGSMRGLGLLGVRRDKRRRRARGPTYYFRTRGHASNSL